MKEGYRSPMGRICVLDIETAPDPIALSYAEHPTRARADAGPLHRLTDASVLLATEKEDGRWCDFELHSYTAGDYDEERLIRNLDRHLAHVTATTGSVVTFNGLGWDIPTIRRRASRHLVFDLPGVFPEFEPNHVDLMRNTSTRGPWRPGTLKEHAAGLGVPAGHQFGRDGIGAKTRGIRKSQVDVSVTFLLLLYELAAHRRRQDPVILGWRAFGKYLAGMGPHGEHLAQFRRHPLGLDPDEI